MGATEHDPSLGKPGATEMGQAPRPLSVTEADLQELEEEVDESLLHPPGMEARTEARQLLEYLPGLLAPTQRWTVLFTGVLGGLVALGVAWFFIASLGSPPMTSATSVSMMVLVAAALTAGLTYLGAFVVGFGRRSVDRERIDDWLKRLEESLRRSIPPIVP